MTYPSVRSADDPAIAPDIRPRAGARKPGCELVERWRAATPGLQDKLLRTLADDGDLRKRTERQWPTRVTTAFTAFSSDVLGGG